MTNRISYLIYPRPKVDAFTSRGRREIFLRFIVLMNLWRKINIVRFLIPGCEQARDIRQSSSVFASTFYKKK